jgi:acyl-CoA reductase-like NAD-dependent aldehyde dehydrogenase
MLVPAHRQQEAVAIAREAAAGIKVGDPSDPANYMGPLVSATQRDKVRAYIRKGIEEGATLVCGGPDKPAEPAQGYFVAPTIFADVSNRTTIAQEEIFGPVLCIIPYRDEDDGVNIANDTIYGLSGAVCRRPGARGPRGPAPAHGTGGGQRRRLQLERPLRRLQAIGPRTRVRQVRPGGVPGNQGPSAIKG